MLVDAKSSTHGMSDTHGLWETCFRADGFQLLLYDLCLNILSEQHLICHKTYTCSVVLGRLTIFGELLDQEREHGVNVSNRYLCIIT